MLCNYVCNYRVSARYYYFYLLFGLFIETGWITLRNGVTPPPDSEWCEQVTRLLHKDLTTYDTIFFMD